MRHNTFTPYRHHWWRWLMGLTLLAGLLGGWLPATRVARAATITVTTTADTDAQSCTLRDAITAANTDTATGGCAPGAGADTITFAQAVRGSITLETALPEIVTDLTIAGPGAGELTVARSAGVSTPEFRILTINPGATVAVADLTLAGGSADFGGGVFNAGAATLTGVTLSGNSASIHGGGVFNGNTETGITITNSTLKNNTAGFSGGGIYNNLTTARLTNSTLSDNAASSNGGGLYNYQGMATLTGTTLTGNTANRGGGILNNTFRSLILTNATVSGNTANVFGGGIYNERGTAALIDTTLSDNRVDVSNPSNTSGGGIYNDTDGTAALTGTTVSSNTANLGGGIINYGTITLTASTFGGNTAYILGGGLYNDGTATLTDTILSNNRVLGVDEFNSGGGGLYNGGTAMLTGNTFTGNTATDGDGGGLYNDEGGTATVDGTTFTGNTATNGDGGGLANFPSGEIALTNTTFDGNTAITGGGLANSGTATLTNVTVASNTATTSGGGLATTAGTARLINTIVAADQGGTTCAVTGGTIADGGHNIDSAATCGFSDPSSRSAIDPLLEPLAANGGPTQTRAPRLDSPAIDAGDDYRCPLRDQRGITRPKGAHCDIGAVEIAALTYTITASATDQGKIDPVGTTAYASGSTATYTATPEAGQTFTGWTLDGQYVGYANPLKFTVTGNRTLVATFVATPTFSDLGTLSAEDQRAITFLAALGIVNPNGVNGSGQFQPNADVQRAQVAAFVARTFGWQQEFHANSFPDRCDPQGQNCIDDELWNNVAALKDYGVVGGYTDPATCQSAGTTAPCYLPRDVVQRVQIVSVVARSFTKTDGRPTGFWDRLNADPAQYTNVPDSGTQRSDLTTYRANVGTVPGQTSDASFNDPNGNGSRLYMVQVLYAAFNAQFGTDNVP